MKKKFGILENGLVSSLYTITNGRISAVVSDYGAAIIKLFVPDRNGSLSDIVLGFDDPNQYTNSGTFFGALIGRNANRIKHASFPLNGIEYRMDPNDNGTNNLHSGYNYYKNRIWDVVLFEEASIKLRLSSPDGDQGFPGNAEIYVTYILDEENTLSIIYEAVSDKDTIFNLTNHSYFNLAGHENPEKAMEQVLYMPAGYFAVSDKESIPTGELRDVTGTPMDFRTAKPIGKDIDRSYDALELQKGYDHNYEVYTSPCAVLSDPDSGRVMTVKTDCCGIQLYSGNFLDGEQGKDGVPYRRRGGICLETQFYPDAIHHLDWKQPITRAGEKYHSETHYHFSWE